MFIWAAPASLIVFLLAWLIKEIPLRGRADAPGQGSATAAEAELRRMSVATRQ